MTSDHDEMKRVYGAVGKEHTARERQLQFLADERHQTYQAACVFVLAFKGDPVAWDEYAARIHHQLREQRRPDATFEADCNEIYDRAKVGR